MDGERGRKEGSRDREASACQSGWKLADVTEWFARDGPSLTAGYRVPLLVTVELVVGLGGGLGLALLVQGDLCF
jgi:hypothetical protein